MLATAGFISDVVTALALPAAILSFWIQRTNERENKERMIYESLSSSYDDFLKLVLANPDLKLWTKEASRNLSDEQEERLIVLFELLASLFERAYLLTYSETMSLDQSRRWASWDNYMRQWCRREDFRLRLPRLLRGDDPDFVTYIMRLADEECVGAAARETGAHNTSDQEGPAVRGQDT